MISSAKCTACEKLVINAHMERHESDALHGGSAVYTAVAFPCGHVLGAVPETWEQFMHDIQAQNQEILQRIHELAATIARVERAMTHLKAS